MAGLLLNLTPLRTSPAFRRLWSGQAVSNIGNGLTTFALALQTFRIIGSSAAVGLLTAAGALPLVPFGVLGGVIADRMERRRRCMSRPPLFGQLMHRRASPRRARSIAPFLTVGDVR